MTGVRNVPISPARSAGRPGNQRFPGLPFYQRELNRGSFVHVGMDTPNPIGPKPEVEKLIYLIRGHKVMLDRDLATLYNVTTYNLNKAVRRNIGRFPGDFMFQLTRAEYRLIRFQFGVGSV